MSIEARLREVDRRYARKRPETSLSNIRWAELRKLFRYKLGPEPSKQDLDNAIREAVGGDPMALSAASIGEAVKLTLAQRGYLDIRTMMPIDATPTQLKAFYRERKRERDRKRWRKRANVKEVSNMQTNVSRLDVLRDVIRTSHDKDPAH